MARKEKLVEKMKNRPSGIQYSEIAKVLRHHGYDLVRTNGSHKQFRNKAGDVITIKKEQPLKAVYVKDVLDRIGE
ncbi:type II toxin-antitoxin system HicA family toxin [Paenibacillus popilliae]|uniref:Predicted lipoprotein n=1 Tax=Paenibacillus popilliae ATCC 14706 TaxID=1212764 RepID=M9LQU1_PAEPP|nr:type II toxin-antitoxin system HicA family toxin [Paenibacillus popilliae]GAC43431.1 predicted lipoprotein [Paenibacillus popilliae ATCC 14706]